MSLSWGSIAGAFLAPFIYGLFWRRTTAVGAFAGMCSGIATTVVLFFTLDKSLASFGACVGMLVPFIVVPVVSLFTKPVPQNIVDKAFSIRVK
jgi:SSS family solute:Na+ symporter